MRPSKIITVVLIGLMVMSCNKDEVPSTGFGVLNPQIPEGIELTLNYPDGTEKTLSGDSVFGWSNGALLNYSYYKHLHGGSEELRFAFRFSIPKDVQAEDIIEGVHALRSSRLKLENTQSLNAVQAEFWLGSLNDDDEFDALRNAEGTIEIKVGQQGFDIIAEIEGAIVNREGQSVRIVGNFWKMNAQE